MSTMTKLQHPNSGETAYQNRLFKKGKSTTYVDPIRVARTTKQARVAELERQKLVN